MLLEINDTKTIGEIVHEFSARYPLLKIEFFKNKHNEGAGSKPSELIHHSKKIGEVGKKATSGSLLIKEEMLVTELEILFWDVFGLSVQVFRKSGNVWIETTTTDRWTLKKQNENAAYQD